MLLSIIVPTYKEAENLEHLTSLIYTELSEKLKSFLHKEGSSEYEILIIDDDSQDGSDEIVDRIQKSKIPVRLINRRGKKRGLSAAVIDGIMMSKGKYLCVMDADLSHPPAAIKPMLDKLTNQEADFCLGSRYTEGGSIDKEWTISRRVISLVASMMAAPLVKIKDPMSGFFVLSRAKMPPVYKLSPIGYKIALEIMIKGDFKQIYEHPIDFKQRLYGTSKMNVRQQIYYLRHLRRLYKFKYPVPSELMHFGMVGSSGFVVDVSIYYAVQLIFGINHVMARAISFWISASWNWLWNRTITFSDNTQSRAKKDIIKQWITFILVCSCGFLINWGLYSILTLNISYFAQYKILALIVGVFAGLGFNFMFSRIFVFSELEKEEA